LYHWVLLLDQFRFCETHFTTYQGFVADQSAISPFLGGMFMNVFMIHIDIPMIHIFMMYSILYSWYIYSWIYVNISMNIFMIHIYILMIHIFMKYLYIIFLIHIFMNRCKYIHEYIHDTYIYTHDTYIHDIFIYYIHDTYIHEYM